MKQYWVRKLLAAGMVATLLLVSACQGKAAPESESDQSGVSGESGSGSITQVQQSSSISEAPSSTSSSSASAAVSSSSQQQSSSSSAASSSAVPSSSSTQASEPSSAVESSSSQEPVKSAGAPDAGQGAYLSSVEKDVIALINQERASLGLSELRTDANLRTAARIRSNEMLLAGTFDHSRPDGRSWESVIKTDVPLRFATAGENLSMYEDISSRKFSGQDWFNQWYNSPLHYENMIHEEFTHVGVGIYELENAQGVTTTIATTIFCSYR